jgi:hypothetical protein
VCQFSRKLKNLILIQFGAFLRGGERDHLAGDEHRKRTLLAQDAGGGPRADEVGVGTGNDIDKLGDSAASSRCGPAFASFRAGGVEAIDVLSFLFGYREELGRLSLTHKLPAICEWREMAEAGCVASYGYRLSEGYAMLAALTDKMLKGAPPGETPTQQATRFELVINRKVARAIGIEIRPSILARADEVIE